MEGSCESAHVVLRLMESWKAKGTKKENERKGWKIQKGQGYM